MSAWKRLAGLLGGLCRARGLSCQVIKQWGGWISLQCSLLKGLVRTTGLALLGADANGLTALALALVLGAAIHTAPLFTVPSQLPAPYLAIQQCSPLL